MPSFECSKEVSTTIEDTIDAPDRDAAFAAFKAKHGVWPDYIDADAALTICESCERPLFDGDDYFSDDEGVAVCKKCCPVPDEEE